MKCSKIFSPFASQPRALFSTIPVIINQFIPFLPVFKFFFYITFDCSTFSTIFQTFPQLVYNINIFSHSLTFFYHFSHFPSTFNIFQLFSKHFHPQALFSTSFLQSLSRFPLPGLSLTQILRLTRFIFPPPTFLLLLIYFLLLKHLASPFSFIISFYSFSK